MFLSFAKSLRAFLAAAAVLLSIGARGNHTDLDFFEPLTTPSGQQLPLHAMENRVRPVSVVTRLLERDRFNLNLFPGTSFPAERIRTDDYGNGDFVWVGRIAGEPLSRVTFAVRNGTVSGVVDRALENGNELYELSPTSDGDYILLQANETKLPKRAPGVKANTGPAPEPTTGSTDTQMEAALTADFATSVAAAPIVQDVMLLYTAASVTKYGLNGIESKILQAISDANSAHQNSQVNVQLNVVYLGQVDYVETGDMGAALSSLQGNGDGVMDEVHLLRNQVGADLVCLIDEDPNYCGIAYVMQTVDSTFAPWAFSVVNSGCLSSLTLPHELGHNQGSQHDRANASFPGAYPYGYGWRNCATDGTGFRTVMSYSCTGGTRVPYFSNPNLTLYGIPLGVAYEVDPANAADNARSINNTAATIAAFRTGTVTPPVAPSGLAANPASSSQIDLTWVDNSSNEANFLIERSPDASVWTQIATVGANVTTYSNTGLAGSSTFSYRVRASNSGGFSDYTAVVSATTPAPPPPPSAPASLSATAVSSSQINLAWSDVSGESGFKVERSPDGITFVQIATTAANVLAYSDTGRAPATSYTYRVRAYNTTGDSGYSPTAAATTLQAPPATPAGLTGTSLSSSQIRLNWGDVANETGYVLERSLSSNGSWTVIASPGAGVLTYTDGNLAPLTTYYYRVKAVNSAGSSAYSNTASAKTKKR